jgi:CheY-like chemotaxis protein
MIRMLSRPRWQAMEHLVTQTAGTAERILIVEDEGMIAHHIASVLEKAGYKIAGIAASSEEVFAIITEQPPDLILMDIHIDGLLDGIETAEKVLENLAIPIIFLSAYTDQLTVDRAKTAGTFEFLSKPVNWPKLLAAITETLERHHSTAGCR